MTIESETNSLCCTIVITDNADVEYKPDMDTLLVKRDCSKEEGLALFVQEQVDYFYLLKQVRSFRMTISNYSELVIAVYLLLLRDEGDFEINVFIHPAPLLYDNQLLENEKYREMMAQAMKRSDSDPARMESMLSQNDPSNATSNEQVELERMLAHSHHLFALVQGGENCRGNIVIPLARKLENIKSIAFAYHCAPAFGRVAWEETTA